METIYKSALLDHFHNPRHKGDLEAMDHVARGSNPRCGDEIEIGVRIADETLHEVRFRGRGCSICLASASIMCDCTSGKTLDEAEQQLGQMLACFDGAQCPLPSPTSLAALAALREHSARRKCVLLAWTALQEILAGLGS